KTVLEVEHPGHVTGPGQREIAEAAARIAFWTRCGCQLLPVSGYAMPGLTDTMPPEPMLLLASVTATIDDNETASVVRAIYQHRYQLGPDHPLAAAALA